ncbi:MAG: AAA family ATPase, partial [Blautia sp.]|nr:AAA family ATPase [Blautia sp.]
MGSYLNPGATSFRNSLRSEIYIDKSGLIEKTNKRMHTEQRYICVSRPRRFGKSMAANMLAAYYGREENTEELFDNLKISKESSYREHLNQYDVIKINMQEFLSATSNVDEMLTRLKKYLIFDLLEVYEKLRFRDETDLIQVMKDIFVRTNHQFVILIDEWDCLFREYKQDDEAQKKYLDFLRAWLKDQDYVALAYMTGILPVKKYGSHSALNMFTEYSMLNPRDMAEYFGFTGEEVKSLCSRYDRN